MSYKLRRTLQFSAEPQCRWNHHRLAAKMLVRALLDIATVSKEKDELQHKKDALRWVKSSHDPSYVLSFTSCCNMLQINADRMMQIAISYASGNSSGSPRPIGPSNPLERPEVPGSQVLGLHPLLALIQGKRRVSGSQTDFED